MGDFRKVMIYHILPFKSKVYSIEGLGILPLLTFNIGLVNLVTFNINSYDKDLPQLTIDLTFTMKKR